jgi:hypothetical protein
MISQVPRQVELMSLEPLMYRDSINGISSYIMKLPRGRYTESYIIGRTGVQ